MDASNAVFISYRRKVGGLWALAIYQSLTRHPTSPIDAFYDIEALQHAGNFNERLLAQIASRPYFAVVLTPATLDRCTSRTDWLRREIEHAVTTRRLVIPVFTPGFDVADFARFLPARLADELGASQGITVNEEFFTEAMARLHDKLLVPVALATASVDDEDETYRRQALEAVDARPLVTTRELEERGLAQRSLPQPSGQPVTAHAAPDVDDQAAVLHHRAVLLEAKGDVAAAIASMQRAAELEPDDPRHATELQRLRDRRRRRRAVTLLGVAAVVVAVAVGGFVLARALDDDGRTPIGTTLRSDERLQRDQSMQSDDGETELSFTSGGELVASTGGREWWQQPAGETAGAYAELQRDGNFVVYTADERTAVWATATDGNQGAYLRVEHTGGRGRLTVYDRDGDVLWRAAEGARGERSMLRAEEGLERDDRLTSADGRRVVELRGGALVATTDGRETFRVGRSAAFAVMQRDGNFVVSDEDGVPVFHTATHTSGGSYLVVGAAGRDGDPFTIYDQFGHVVWPVDDGRPAPHDEPDTTTATTTRTDGTTAHTDPDTTATAHGGDHRLTPSRAA